MVQPKYNPQESLERIKLMMNYDSRKTLTENKKSINEIAPLVAWGIVAATAAGLTALGIRSEWSTADSEEKLRLISATCDENKPEVQRKTMSSPDWTEVAGKLRKAFTYSILGTGYGTDLESLRAALNDLKQRGNLGDFCEVRKLFLPDKLEDELIDELNTSEILEVVTAIEYLIAKSGKGNVKTRDEETANTSWWLDTFPCLEDTRSLSPGFTVSSDGYGNTMVPVKFKVKGVLKDFWIDQKGRVLIGPDSYNTQQTGKIIVCSGRKVTLVSESITKKKLFREQAEFDVDIKPVSDDTGGDQGGGDQGGGEERPVQNNCPNGYPVCTGTYKMCCKSPKIGEIQRCLGGLNIDNRWGPKTQQALESKFSQFAVSFTDNDVQTICGGTGGGDMGLKGPDIDKTVTQIDVTKTDF